MPDTAGKVAAHAARCRNFRRGIFMTCLLGDTKAPNVIPNPVPLIGGVGGRSGAAGDRPRQKPWPTPGRQLTGVNPAAQAPTGQRSRATGGAAAPAAVPMTRSVE